MILTLPALALMMIPALLLYARAWWPVSAAWPLAAGLAVVALLIYDNRFSRRRVELELGRELDEKLSLGAENPVHITVRNRSGAAVSLQVKDDPPADFPTPIRLHHLRLQPWEQVKVSYHTRPVRRGKYQFGNLHVRGRSLLGLSYWQRSFPAAQEVAVYPNLLEISRYQYLARADRLRQAGFRVVHRLGEGTEFESLRDYSPDDEYRSIDWKATARRHKPTTRQYEVERSQTVLIMIDAGRMMTAQIGDLSRLDYAINAALMLAYVASEKNDSVGLITFAEEVKKFVPPRKGKGQISRITEALYDLQPALVEPDYAAAFGLLYGRARKRALVVCFTDLVDVDASRRLLAHLASLAPHHLPLLITLRDSTLEQAAQQKPDDEFHAYQKAMAGEVLADREVALGVLRQRGVLVLDAAPEKLTVSAVNEYLRLKARGRL
ncbi:MAG: DUF58 domain-containing protein [Armatimonadota bacterium]